MGSIIIFAIVTLWLIVMVPAVAAPFLLNRSKNGANVTPKPFDIPTGTRSGHGYSAEIPEQRTAA